MEITRLLGIRYIWIDSLCIIQGDAEEWKREAVRMAEIYEHAEVVVSALRSDDGYSGFLGPRIPHIVAHPFQTTGQEKTQGCIFFRLSASSSELERGPLNQRG